MPTDTDHPDPTTIEEGQSFGIKYASVYAKSHKTLSGTVDDVDPLSHRDEESAVTIYVIPEDEDTGEATNRVQFDHVGGEWKAYSVETRHNGGWNRISRVLGIESWTVTQTKDTVDAPEDRDPETSRDRSPDETEIATDGGTSGAVDDVNVIVEAMIPDEDHDGEVQEAEIQLTRQHRRGVNVTVAGPTPISAADLQRIGEQVSESVDLDAAPDLEDGQRVDSTTVGTVEYLPSDELVDVEVSGS